MATNTRLNDLEMHSRRQEESIMVNARHITELNVKVRGDRGALPRNA